MSNDKMREAFDAWEKENECKCVFEDFKAGYLAALTKQPESEPYVTTLKPAEADDGGEPGPFFSARDWLRLGKLPAGVGLHLVPQPSAQVPEVATIEMVLAGEMSLANGIDKFPGNFAQIVSNIWEDMRAAAPSIAEKPDLDANLFIIDGMDYTEVDEQEIALYHSECLPLNSSNIVTVERWHKLSSRNMKVSVDAEARVEWEWVDSPLTGAE